MLDFAAIALVVGAIFIVLALVGGGMSLKGKEIGFDVPLIPPLLRVISFIFGLVLVVIGIWRGVFFIPVTSGPTPSTTLTVQFTPTFSLQATLTPVQTPSVIITGNPILIGLPSGETTTIGVNPKVGDIGRLIDLTQKGVATPVQILDEWNIPQPLPEVWDAYQLPEGGRDPCPEWISRYNSASLKFDLSQTILVFAEKAGDFPVSLLFPMGGTGEIPILDNIARGDRPSGGGPLSASIQIFLVPSGTTGQITIFEQNDFGGAKCTLVFGT